VKQNELARYLEEEYQVAKNNVTEKGQDKKMATQLAKKIFHCRHNTWPKQNRSIRVQGNSSNRECIFRSGEGRGRNKREEE